MPLVFVLLSLLANPTHALQFSPASPAGQLAHPAVTAVTVSASAPQVVYAAAGPKLFRSPDAGDTWVALATPSPAIDQLAVDPADSTIVYLVGQRHLYRSDDRGATWKDLGTTLGSVLAPLRFDPQDSSTIYAGARCSSSFPNPRGGGVYRSSDRGDTWVLLSSSVSCVDFLSLDPAAPRRLFAATSPGAQYRTDDAGRSWRPVTGELPVFDVVADPLDPSRHYGLGRGPAGDGFVHFVASNDAGASWSWVPAEGLPPGGQQLAIDPAMRRLFLLGQSFGLYVSDDLGLHWRHLAAVPSLPATNLNMTVAEDRIYVATANGLHRLPMSDPDAPAVIHLGEPAPLNLAVYGVAVDPHDAATVYATAYEGYGILDADRVFRSTDSGRTWESITAEDDTDRRYVIAVDAVGDLYAAGKQTMWRFAKATQTWETWNAPELYEPAILLANPQRPGWLYAANTGWAGYSIDGGRTWTQIWEVTSGFWSLSIASNGSDLVGGNNDGSFASSDGGVTWRELPTGRQVTKAVAIAPSRPATIYRLTNTAFGGLQSGLFRSDDGGETWTALHWPGERDFTQPIAVDPLDYRSVWIGLAHSTDAGVTWTIEPSNLPSEVLSLAFSYDGTQLYAHGRDYKVWRATIRGSRRRAALASQEVQPTSILPPSKPSRSNIATVRIRRRGSCAGGRCSARAASCAAGKSGASISAGSRSCCSAAARPAWCTRCPRTVRIRGPISATGPSSAIGCAARCITGSTATAASGSRARYPCPPSPRAIRPPSVSACSSSTSAASPSLRCLGSPSMTGNFPFARVGR